MNHSQQEWVHQLQRFLDGRLRTTSFRIASTANTVPVIPNLPMNTQYLIDGIMIAIEDHGVARPKESVLAIINHLKACFGRWDQVRNHVEMRFGRRAVCDDEVATVPAAVRYGTFAALQDVLLAWYVLDAAIKSRGASQTSVAALAAAELPQALSHYLPLFSAGALLSRSTCVKEAIGEYRDRFVDMVRSWFCSTSPSTVSSSALSPSLVLSLDIRLRCEEYIRQRLKVVVEQETLELNNSKDGDRDEHNSGDAQRETEVLRVLLKSLASHKRVAAVEPVTQSSLTDGSATLRGQALVDHFIQQAFDRHRTRGCCPQCSMLISDDVARIHHLKTHFLSKEQRERDPAVRLRFPSQDDFMNHIPYVAQPDDKPANARAGDDDGEERYFPSLFCRTTEAYKPNFNATVVVRKLKDGERSKNGKRLRDGTSQQQQYVQVSDISKSYTCAVCHQPLQPVQHTVTMEWVLEGCTRTSDGVNVAHVGCL